MKENVINTFIKETYNKTSPIPYIVTIQVIVFVLIHIFELLNFSGSIQLDLYAFSIQKLSLPASLSNFLTQPWSLITHPILYTALFNLLFDCLWLYWMGNIFLTYLNSRQFLTVFLAGILISAIAYLGIGSIPIFHNDTLRWNTSGFGLAALISSVYLLAPNFEVQLLLFGRVKLKVIALVYLALEFAFLTFNNRPAAFAYLIATAIGLVFITQLQKGNDWSKFFVPSGSKRKLKVIRNINHPAAEQVNTPNQEQIDQILDKISLNGYENLTSKEKETLFKASKH